jgi:uncharacterized protein YndB with AHSA1/START domain
MNEAQKLSLEIKRFINASRDRVYAAWTDPEQLKKWFGPENVKTRNLVADVRVGGQFRWDCTDPEGKEVTISGEYRPVRRSCSPGGWKKTKTGKITTASSRWNFLIVREAPRST